MEPPVDDQERALREEVLAVVLRRAPLVVFALDRDGRCIFSEGAGLQLVGLEPGEAVGRDLFEMYAGEPDVVEPIRRALAGEAFRAEYHRPEVDLETWWVPMRDAGGQVSGAVGVSIDVTEITQARQLADSVVAHQRGMLLHLHEAQEVERRRIAGEIHDDTIQVLAAVNLRLHSLRRALNDGPGAGGRTVDLVAAIDALDDAIRRAVTRLRLGLVQLDPPPVADEGIEALIRRHAESALVETPVAWTVVTEIEQEPSELVGGILLRIAQEALTNVRKHAMAGQVEVALRQVDGEFRLTVADDGVGIGLAAERGDPLHLGLRLMADRAESAGGWWRIGPRRGGGTLMEAGVPVRISFPDPHGSLPVLRTFVEQTMDSITDGYAALDRDWRVVYLNTAGYRMLDRDPADPVIGQRLWDTLEVSPHFAGALRQAMAEQRPVTASGHFPPTDRWIELRILPAAGGLSVFVRDVTDEMRTAEQAEESGRRIDLGNRVVRALVEEADLATALRRALAVIVAGWRLGGVRLTATGVGAAGADLVVTAGDPSADGRRSTRPLTCRGRPVGAVELAGEGLPVSDQLLGLLALRIAAES